MAGESTMRVLIQHDSGIEEIIPCVRAVYRYDEEARKKAVSLYLSEDKISVFHASAEFMVLGDDGKCVHRWTI